MGGRGISATEEDGVSLGSICALALAICCFCLFSCPYAWVELYVLATVGSWYVSCVGLLMVTCVFTVGCGWTVLGRNLGWGLWMVPEVTGVLQ